MKRLFGSFYLKCVFFAISKRLCPESLRKSVRMICMKCIELTNTYHHLLLGVIGDRKLPLMTINIIYK